MPLEQIAIELLRFLPPSREGQSIRTIRQDHRTMNLGVNLRRDLHQAGLRSCRIGLSQRDSLCPTGPQYERLSARALAFRAHVAEVVDVLRLFRVTFIEFGERRE